MGSFVGWAGKARDPEDWAEEVDVEIDSAKSHDDHFKIKIESKNIVIWLPKKEFAQIVKGIVDCAKWSDGERGEEVVEQAKKAIDELPIEWRS